MEEVWKDIEGFEGLYQVSNLGNVKSLNYNHTKKEKKLCKRKDKSGYLYVNLCKQGKHKSFKIHRLVSKAFIENPNNYSFVNHKDENKQNNVVTNLEWCTHKYNCNYGTRNKRMCEKLINRNDESKLVYQYSKYGVLISVFNSTNEAKRQGFNQGHVASCCRGERKSHKGYIWSYKPIK